MTTKSTFVSSHPSHVFDTEDSIDYSERNQHFIQCLKALEALMDIDAYILDYMNKKILYVTKGSSLFLGQNVSDSQIESISRELHASKENIVLWMTSKEKGICILRNSYMRRILRQELLVIGKFLNISILYH